MITPRRIATILLMGLLMTGLAGCGKKPGILKPPPPASGDASAMKTYPASKDDL